MTSGRIVIGALFIVVLIFSIVYAAVAPIVQPISFPRIQTPFSFLTTGNTNDYYSLVKGVNASNDINFVILNITAKFAGTRISFANDPNLIVNASFSRGANSPSLQANASSFLNTMELDLYGESGGLHIVFGNSCQYGGLVDLRIGGVTMDIDDNAHIGVLLSSIRYFGGINLNITDDASVERLSYTIDVGGLQMNFNATEISNSPKVDVFVNIGGVSINVNPHTLVGIRLQASVDTGGISLSDPDFAGTNSTTSCDVRNSVYSSAPEKLQMTATVGLGGVSLQNATLFQLPAFGP